MKSFLYIESLFHKCYIVLKLYRRMLKVRPRGTNLSVCEEENSVFVLNSSNVIQSLQVLMEGCVVVTTRQLNLEALVATDV